MSNGLPKIAFCWRSSSLTGAQRRFLALAYFLNKKGQDAIILLEKRDAVALEEITGSEIPHLVSFEWPWWVRLLRLLGRGSIYQIWKLLGFRALFHFTSAHYLKSLQKDLGISLWHVSMSSHLAHSVPGHAVFEVTSPDWADKVVEKPDTVPQDMLLHAVSDNVYNCLIQGLPNRRIRRAPDMFPNLDPATVTYPDITKKENLIVFAHRLVPRKNGALFAEVVKRFLDVNPEWRVSFRGEGPDEQVIRQILGMHILAGRAEVGYIANLADELRRSRIFVSIIEQDNYPSQSVLEAMLHGNALLLSDRGCTREKFFGGNGVMTDIHDESVFISLSHLAANVNKTDQMGLLSFELARKNFSRERYLEHLEKIYCEVGFLGGES